ncbi:unnamed protein product [Mytilus coruscus]|uniref:COR domain-containing protein n=1 Tax=Mytilus coruscus TaxID=42192 RepID=A0A6J8AI99_MYTCO|nr:unnamed protein product [Mytilus coruscus]
MTRSSIEEVQYTGFDTPRNILRILVLRYPYVNTTRFGDNRTSMYKYEEFAAVADCDKLSNDTRCFGMDSYWKGWDMWTPALRTLFTDVKTGSPNEKYDGKALRNGYTLIIQNLTKKDLNVSYACVYGAEFGDKQILLEEDVFTDTTSTQQNIPTEDDRLSGREIVGILVGVVVFAAFMSAVFLIIYVRRKKRKRTRNTNGSIAGSNTGLDDNVPLMGLDDNVPLMDIPKEIGTESMEERNIYMEAIKSGKEMRKFVRIQVIGKDRVGKTSLVRRLLGQGIDDIKSTDGIDIARQCQIKTSDGEWIVGEVETKRNEMIRRILQAVKMKLKGSEPLSASDQHLFETNNMQDGDEPGPIDEQRIGTEVFDETHIISGDKISNIISAAPHNAEDNIADPFDMFNENPNTETPDSSAVPPVISETSNQIPNNIIETAIENMDDILLEAQSQKEKMAADGLVQCGIWDFAGQKDYYATHQTFFTPHAIYILVTDIEDEIGDTKHDQSFDSIGDYIGFWFDSIHCFCKDHSAVKLCPPVVMVCTGSDKVPVEKVEDKKEEYENTFLRIFGCHKKVNHRRSIHFISNTQPLEEEIRILKNKISQIAKEMKYFAEELPTRWIKLENALDVLKDLNVNVSSWQDIQKLANENLIEEKELLLFLKYQHQIGNIIFLEDKRDYIILQPNWLVKCFRCLVCDNDKKNYGSSTTTERYRLKYEGQLSDNLIDELFKKDSELKFGEYKHHILDVMEKFEIIVKPQFLDTNNRTYYIPCMIENSSTLEDIKKKLNTPNARCTPWLVFEFKFLPIAYHNHILFSYIRNYKVCKEKSGDTMGDGRPALYAGKAVVYLDDTRYKMLIICLSRNAIAIQIWRWSEVDDNTYKHILIELCSKIAELERKLMHKLHYEIKAKCNTGDYASSSDRIGYEDLIKRCVGGEYRCEEHDSNHSKDDIENTWLKHVPALAPETIIKADNYGTSIIATVRVPADKIPVQFTKEELNFAIICMVVLNILADILYDLLEQDKTNLRPRSDCDISYLFDEHRKLNKHIPTNGWVMSWQHIQNTDIAIGDDIQRIALTRNEILHYRTFTLDEKRYEDLCGIIVDLVERFDQHNKPSILYTDNLKEIFDKISFEKEVRFTKGEIYHAKMAMIVMNILADVSYDLLKQDKPNLPPRNECDDAESIENKLSRMGIEAATEH